MTPTRAYLLSLVVNQRERAEALRARALLQGVPTDRIDGTLLQLAALQREITGEAVALVAPDWDAKPCA